MKVTIDKIRTEKMGLEVTNVSVVFDNHRNILMIHGMLLPKPSYHFDENKSEPNVLCSFYDDQERVYFSSPAHEYISFILNQYGFFSLEVDSEKLDIQRISEIRLTPYYTVPTNSFYGQNNIF